MLRSIVRHRAIGVRQCHEDGPLSYELVESVPHLCHLLLDYRQLLRWGRRLGLRLDGAFFGLLLGDCFGHYAASKAVTLASNS